MRRSSCAPRISSGDGVASWDPAAPSCALPPDARNSHSARFDPLRPQLGEGAVALPDLEAHRLQHGRRLRELHLVVLHDLNEIAPGIAEVEPPTGQDLGISRLE